VLVCVQGAFGAWTVTMKLQPIIVGTHLMLAMLLLSGLIWLGSRNDRPRQHDPGSGKLYLPALIGTALLVIQIALGGWVSTNYAVLACTDFPLCNGELVPRMDFQHGFTLWRELGKTAAGDYIPRDALVAIHWVHRMFAFVVFAYLGWFAVRSRRYCALRRLATLLIAFLSLQLLTGLSNIVLDWPLFAAVAHNGGAAVLLMLMVRLVYNTRLARQSATVPIPAVSAART
jgi:cytochrome c oxidase assembly protein subunit 15